VPLTTFSLPVSAKFARFGGARGGSQSYLSVCLGILNEGRSIAIPPINGTEIFFKAVSIRGGYLLVFMIKYLSVLAFAERYRAKIYKTKALHADVSQERTYGHFR
jgi:hypothetical protein